MQRLSPDKSKRVPLEERVRLVIVIDPEYNKFIYYGIIKEALDELLRDVDDPVICCRTEDSLVIDYANHYRCLLRIHHRDTTIENKGVQIGRRRRELVEDGDYVIVVTRDTDQEINEIENIATDLAKQIWPVKLRKQHGN